MIFLSGCVCKELMGLPNFGFMVTPRMSNRLPRGQIWAADTGCYQAGDEFRLKSYLRWLKRQDPKTCLFATCPDVLGDWAATLERSRGIPAQLRSLGYVPALVAQDGATPDTVPWEEIGALFIGGTTEWKMRDRAVIQLLDEAGSRGIWRHLGRVNSGDRSMVAKLRGCDSVDGTYLVFGKDILLSQVKEWMDVINRQQSFF